MNIRHLLLALGFSMLAFAFVAHRDTDLPVDPAPEPDDYPKNYFQCPVDGQLRLTGTFGELRPDHFHAGLDFKSATGGTGQPIYAAADGVVDVIKVQSTGYGNVLFIKHPNGYTTVYAHLEVFAPEIAAWVKEQQYKKETFEVELNPSPEQFRIKKGQEIGKLGNTGSSSGPHLHFEIRNTTGKAVNPQLFNLGIPDEVAPDLRDMKVYFLDDHRQVLGSRTFPLKKDKKGRIGLEGDTVLVGGWRIGFGVKAYDEMTGFRNDNGIYKLSMLVDDQLSYEWRINEFDMDDTRYMNAHIDYPARQRQGAWFHRLFVLPGDRLGNYTRTETMGSIAIYKEKPVKVTVNVADARGNTTTLQFWVMRDEANMETFNNPPYQYEFAQNKENRIDLEDFKMTMSPGCLYEDLKMEYVVTPPEEDNMYSSLHHLHRMQTPVHKNFTLSLKPHGLPPHLKPKAVVARCGDGRPDNCGGEWKGEYLSTQVRSFGAYCIMTDTVPPGITPTGFTTDLRKKKEMSFRIRDNFAVSGTAEGLRYRGTIDGQWVLFEFDKKNNRLKHTFDARTGPGEHVLRLVVSDDRGNERVFEKTFLR